ncbi:LOW QUALITY PROTEIN: uncharacterized protein PS065_018460 [Dugong dugon]
MSNHDPLSLSDLAMQSLLSDKNSIIHALEELPVGLFITEAFNGGHTKTVERFLGNYIVHDFPWDLTADSLLSSMGHLKKLHLIFGCLSGKLHKLLSSLQKPLESLVVSGCRLTMNDIAYLSSSVHATCLKELVLSNNNLSQMVPRPPEVLLGQVSGTLQHLNLRSCGMEESQLKALLPALCSCFLLHSLVLGDNIISTSCLMNVLQHLTGLKELKHVQYPVRCVVYLDDSRSGNLSRVKLAQMHTTLQGKLQAVQWEDMRLTNSTSISNADLLEKSYCVLLAPQDEPFEDMSTDNADEEAPSSAKLLCVLLVPQDDTLKKFPSDRADEAPSNAKHLQNGDSYTEECGFSCLLLTETPPTTGPTASLSTVLPIAASAVSSSSSTTMSAALALQPASDFGVIPTDFDPPS